MFDEDSMPCLCDQCGNWFDLSDGYGCDNCNIIFCPKCIGPYNEPKICETCKTHQDD